MLPMLFNYDIKFTQTQQLTNYNVIDIEYLLTDRNFNYRIIEL